MNRHSMGSAPDYTTAALFTCGINLFCLLAGIWAISGFGWALLTAAALFGLLRRFEKRRQA